MSFLYRLVDWKALITNMEFNVEIPYQSRPQVVGFRNDNSSLFLLKNYSCFCQKKQERLHVRMVKDNDFSPLFLTN